MPEIPEKIRPHPAKWEPAVDRGSADREAADGETGSDAPPASPTAGFAVTSRPSVVGPPSAVFGQRSSVDGQRNSGDRHLFANDAKTSQSPLGGPYAYAELAVTSNFTFLTGASHPDELVAQAAGLGCAAVAITDTNTLAGIVRAHVAAKETGIQLVVGCRLRVRVETEDGESGGRRGDAETPRRGENSEDRENEDRGTEDRGTVDRGSGDGETVDRGSGDGETVDRGTADGEAEAKWGQARFSANNAKKRASPRFLDILVYPTDLASYGRLCTLLSLGKRRAPKGECHLVLHDLLEAHEGLLAAVVPPEVFDQDFLAILGGLKNVFDDDRLSLAASCPYGQDDRGRLERLAILSAHTGVPLLATNDVHYHVPQRRPLQDVLTCIRHGCTIATAGLRLLPNAERHLKTPAEMARLFAAYPEAIRRTAQVAHRAAGFSLDQLRYQYPDEVCPPGLAPMEHLRNLAWQGAGQRYPGGVSPKVVAQLEHELELIDELRFAQYFLTVHDLVNFARDRGILCQGRGAAANSAVCFCLGVTSVDPERIDVLFERFISRERNEPPDIDIDFEHERREEVIQYIYGKYGRHRAALTAEVISYRGRLAVREVGKVLGLSEDCVDRLAKSQDWWDEAAIGQEALSQAGLSLQDPTIAALVGLTNDLAGFPRHLSQHVGGFVITRDRLCELVPIENAAMPDRTIIEWDKDDIDALGMMKVDCLGLGMMTCIRKCLEMVNQANCELTIDDFELSGNDKDKTTDNRQSSMVNSQWSMPLTLATIPPEDPAVYDMICAADTVGVFQIESRAQMSMLPRLRPRCFYDLVIEVAIVRPGPIVGDMVHPYLRRRQGLEAVDYPNEKVRQVLGKTLGVPLFQEQAMKLAMVAGGFSPDQADQLRRAIASKRSKLRLEELGQQLISGMVANGYKAEFAQRCFKQFQGFSHYGFPESHAASFALLVYASCWLKRHYPAAFAASLLNSQPMGFYAPAQIIADVQRHGVKVLGADVNSSGWDCRLEENRELRMGMRMIKGMNHADALAIETAVAARGRFDDIESLYRASGVKAASLRNLAAADAFGSMGLDRQAALWQIRAISDEPMPLFESQVDRDTLDTSLATLRDDSQADMLPPVSEFAKVMQDYQVTGLSLRRHPMAFLRPRLEQLKAVTTRQIRDPSGQRHGSFARVAGVVLVRQRPSSAKGVLFMTIEDETGTANVMIRPAVVPRLKKAMAGSILLCSGRVERSGAVVHVVVTQVQDISDEMRALSVGSRNFR